MYRAFLQDSQAIDGLERDLAAPGGLSVVLQGGLFKNNAVDVANHVRHLQLLFPAAQIIVSISSSDIISRDEKSNEVVRPDFGRLNDTILADGLRVIFEGAEVVLASGGLPLPAIKSDIHGNSNNFNLQLTAAQAGLARAHGRYTLRVRNDLYFTDLSFVRFYAERKDIARYKPMFSQRILISSIFLLNPYIFERMPFHFSDWFHFGLTSDISALWQVEPIRFADAVFFRTRSHPVGSNSLESLFYTRLAVEQHLHFSYYQRKLNLEPMDQFNDLRYRELSMQAVLDDFVPIHPGTNNILFEKYKHIYNDYSVKMGCISPEEWEFLAVNREVDPRKFFESKARAASRRLEADAARHKIKSQIDHLVRIFKRRLMGAARLLIIWFLYLRWRGKRDEPSGPSL